MLHKSTFKNKMNCSGTYYTGFTAVQYTVYWDYSGIIQTDHVRISGCTWNLMLNH